MQKFFADDTHRGMRTDCRVVVFSVGFHSFMWFKLIVQEIVLPEWIQILMFLRPLNLLKRLIHLSPTYIAMTCSGRHLYTASSCVIILEKSIQKPSEVNYALHIIWLPCFNLHTPAFVPRHSLWINCRGRNKPRVQPLTLHPKIEAPTLPLLPFVCLPLLQSLISWDVALATGGIFNAQCVVY